MVPAHLIKLGQQTLATVTTNVAGGAPVVRCQLLASEFYEALKRELRATAEMGVVERTIVVAAANLCCHAATASITPDIMVADLRRALDLLQAKISACEPPRRSQGDGLYCVSSRAVFRKRASWPSSLFRLGCSDFSAVPRRVGDAFPFEGQLEART